MPLTGTGTTWGNAVANAIIAANDPDEELSEAEKETIRAGWRTACGEHITHITGNALVGTSVTLAGVSGSGPPGGPLPVVSPAATGTGSGTVS